MMNGLEMMNIASMNKPLRRILLVIALVFVVGCSQAKDFNYGLELVMNTDAKYGVNISTYPKDISQTDLLLKDFEKIKDTKLNTGQEQFNQLIYYRMLTIEAQKYLMNDSLNYGKSGTTKDGFGCKQRPLIIESVALRNHSAEKGFEAVSILRNFAEKYPEEAKRAGVSYKDSLFMNATFYQMSIDARKDSSTINNFCPKSRVLELYQEEFRKKTNLSEEYINNLTYDEAVVIWKRMRSPSATEVFGI